MSTKSGRVFVFVALNAFAVAVFADDCTIVRSAMADTGHKPLSTTTTKFDANGKQSVTRTVQTVTDKYVQTFDGKWYDMGIALKDLTDDLKTAKLTCRRAGSDTVDGESTAVYEFHMDYEGDLSDNKMWISSKNLILRSDVSRDGVRYSTLYDFAHVTPPANSTPMGGK